MTYSEFKKAINKEKENTEIAYIAYLQKTDGSETLVSNFLNENQVSEITQKQLDKAIEESLLEKDWIDYIVKK